MQMELHTTRLTLDALRPDDAESLFRYRADPLVSRFQGWCPASVTEASSFIEGLQAIRLDTPGSWFQRAIRLRGNDMLIGDVGLHFADNADATVELGISLSPLHQGQGLAAEALSGVLAFVFENLGKHRVTGSVDPRNTASLRLLERVGMRKEAHFRESLLMDGAWVDDVIYAMLDREWRDGEASGRHRS
jgi:RimJ/RimL family protein N-acetyltransferase